MVSQVHNIECQMGG